MLPDRSSDLPRKEQIPIAKGRCTVKKGRRCLVKVELLLAFALLQGGMAWAQRPQEPGKVIGKVSTEGNLIVMELDERVLGKANLFDLAGRTLRFTPEGSGYRVENVSLQWDSGFGAELAGP